MIPAPSRMMKRRAIPPLMGILGAAIAGLPLWFPNHFSDDRADQFTLGFGMFIFYFKFIVFGVMRQRMTVESRQLTVFGLALVDFFLGLMIVALVTGTVYGILLYLSLIGEITSQTIRLINRSAIIGSGCFVVGAGTAVLIELRRAGIRLSVHVDDLKEGWRPDFPFDRSRRD